MVDFFARPGQQTTHFPYTCSLKRQKFQKTVPPCTSAPRRLEISCIIPGIVCCGQENREIKRPEPTASDNQVFIRTSPVTGNQTHRWCEQLPFNGKLRSFTMELSTVFGGFYKRKTTNAKKVIYYAKFFDEDGKEYRISTKSHTKQGAEKWLKKYLKEQEHAFERELQRRANMTVKEYAKGFWAHDGAFARSRRARLRTLSNGYLDNCESITRNHIVSRWGRYKLTELTATAIDRWVIDLVDLKGLAPGTINKVFKTFRVMLDQACSDELLKDNPAKFVKQVREHYKPRGVLTPEEIKRLIGSPEAWDDYRHYAINLLTLSTGMRIGEVRGLLLQHVHPTHIEVRHSWEEKYGLKEPKWGSFREIPITPKVYQVLEKVIEDSRPQTLVFYGSNYDQPISKSYIEKKLYMAFGNIGIDEVERRQRNLTFHGHRHALNTMLRSAGVSDIKIRMITGHRDEQMTTRYTHFRVHDFHEVSTIQDTMLSLPDAPQQVSNVVDIP